MSMNDIDKKYNKRKKKKRTEMLLEDYAEKNNIHLNISFSFGSSPEKANKSDTQSNSQDDYCITKNKARLNSNLKKLNSTSTNNSSTDDDIKEKKEKEKERKK